MLEDKELYCGLFEFYKEFLTPNQIKVCEQYFFDDYSLFEIAEQENISKQAVKDTLDKAISNLLKFESSLHLLDKYKQYKKLLANKESMNVNDYVKALESLLEG